MSTVYFSCTDTAKQVRLSLKAAFPEVKFSVRSSVYSGGASIYVLWTDGPTEQAVDAVVDPFKGATFDGMTDLKSYRSALVSVSPDELPQVVQYAADFIFTTRSLSPELTARAREVFEQNWGVGFDDYDHFPPFDLTLPSGESVRIGGGYVQRVVHNIAGALVA